MSQTLNSSGSTNNIYEPPNLVRQNAHCQSFEAYKCMHKLSVEQPEEFWENIARNFYWKTFPPRESLLKYNFDIKSGPISIEWFNGGVTNLSYNLLDRNIQEGRGDSVAFFWEGNDPNDTKTITYAELLSEVCKFSNVLKSRGVRKGDKVAIYMPMIIETIVAIVACSRIGAVHSVVFGGFSAISLAERSMDANCKVLITSDGTWRGKKLLNLKKISDDAMLICETKKSPINVCIVIKHLNVSPSYKNSNSESVEGQRPFPLKVEMRPGRDVWYEDEMNSASDECEPEWMNAEDPLFMLYTSGSTGKPKGVLHTTAGYMIYASTTFKYSFDYHHGDIYWCTADVGWITGHSYVCYGPLANGATSVLFEGTPFYPDPGRFWEIVDKYKVTTFYTAPTAIRALMKYGESYVQKYNRSSLKILATVGEPINPEAWYWYKNIIGNENCTIVDTFWQTETGGHVITPLPGAISTKPGAATFPFFGIVPVILNENGTEVEGENEGYLAFKQPWPGIMRTVFGDQQRFETTYFTKFPGYYCTGDGAKRDSDGYIWITGRIDDMLNVSGHLLSTAQVESVIIEHPDVAENAVVAHPHPVKGECLYCFITLKEGKIYDDETVTELKNLVRKHIGAFAQPDFMQEAPGLPKTRSGKIMRRILRKIAVGDRDLGDVSTMADSTVVDVLFNLRANNA